MQRNLPMVQIIFNSSLNRFWAHSAGVSLQNYGNLSHAWIIGVAVLVIALGIFDPPRASALSPNIGKEESVCPGGCGSRGGDGWGDRSYSPPAQSGPSAEEIARQNQINQANAAARAGHEAYVARNYGLALQNFAFALQISPGNWLDSDIARARAGQAWKLGDQYWAQGKWALVVSSFQDALRFCSTHCTSDFRNGMLSGIELARGLEVWQQADGAWQRNEWGNAARAYDNVAKHYQAALRFRPDDKITQENLARLLEAAKNAKANHERETATKEQEKKYAESNRQIEKIGSNLQAWVQGRDQQSGTANKFFGTGGTRPDAVFRPLGADPNVSVNSILGQASSAAKSGGQAARATSNEEAATRAGCQLHGLPCAKGEVDKDPLRLDIGKAPPPQPADSQKLAVMIPEDVRNNRDIQQAYQRFEARDRDELKYNNEIQKLNEKIAKGEGDRLSLKAQVETLENYSRQAARDKEAEKERVRKKVIDLGYRLNEEPKLPASQPGQQAASSPSPTESSNESGPAEPKSVPRFFRIPRKD